MAYVVTYRQQGRKGRFKSKEFKTKTQAQASIKRFKTFEKKLDRDLPVKMRKNKLFFDHRVKKV